MNTPRTDAARISAYGEDGIEGSVGFTAVPVDFARQLETELAAAQERIKALEGDAPEGCTVADAQVLRKANHEFAEENKRLKDALRFYANGYHFTLGEPEAWDTVSGEPPNFWCDEAGTATVEDGSIAKAVLLGHTPDWKDEDGEDGAPPPIEGEAEYQAAIDAFIAARKGEK